MSILKPIKVDTQAKVENGTLNDWVIEPFSLLPFDQIGGLSLEYGPGLALTEACSWNIKMNRVETSRFPLIVRTSGVHSEDYKRLKIPAGSALPPWRLIH